MVSVIIVVKEGVQDIVSACILLLLLLLLLFPPYVGRL
jgi:hypothetical protein